MSIGSQESSIKLFTASTKIGYCYYFLNYCVLLIRYPLNSVVKCLAVWVQTSQCEGFCFWRGASRTNIVRNMFFPLEGDFSALSFLICKEKISSTLVLHQIIPIRNSFIPHQMGALLKEKCTKSGEIIRVESHRIFLLPFLEHQLSEHQLCAELVLSTT